MNEYIETSIVELYDEYAARVGDDVKVGDGKTAIRNEIRSLIATTDRDIERETDAAIDDAIGRMRSKRSRSMKKNLDYLLDGMTDPEGPYIDPMLGMAFSLGDERGVDKVLRNWTAEDFQNLIVTRYRVAADATEAAAEFDRTAAQIVLRMRAVGAQRVGDVHWTPSGEAA